MNSFQAPGIFRQLQYNTTCEALKLEPVITLICEFIYRRIPEVISLASLLGKQIKQTFSEQIDIALSPFLVNIKYGTRLKLHVNMNITFDANYLNLNDIQFHNFFVMIRDMYTPINTIHNIILLNRHEGIITDLVITYKEKKIFSLRFHLEIIGKFNSLDYEFLSFDFAKYFFKNIIGGCSEIHPMKGAS